MANLSWKIDVQVDGGPAMSASTSSQNIEAIDRIEVTIDPGDTDKVVDIQPGNTDAVQLIVIKSSYYDDDLGFKVSDGATDSDSLVLDAPQVFTAGSVTIFGMAPQQLKFTNTTNPEKTANLEVFIARDATPAP